MSASVICVRWRMPKSRIVDRMAFSAAGLTAGLKPQNMVLSRKRLTHRGRKQYPRKSNLTFGRFAFPAIAVNDFGFRRMQLQVALCQSILKLGPEGFCFSLAPAVYLSIIGIATPGKVGVGPRYPEIERVMHEQIRQNRTNHTALWGAAVSRDYASILLHRRRC